MTKKEEVTEKVKLVSEAMKLGSTMTAACKEYKLNPTTWYQRTGGKKKAKASKKPVATSSVTVAPRTKTYAETWLEKQNKVLWEMVESLKAEIAQLRG